MSLVLRSDRQPWTCATPGSENVYRVEVEQRWFLEGPELLIDLAFQDLHGVAGKLHAQLLELDFGNSVGVYRVRGLGTIEVVSGKWGEAHFDRMLADIAQIASALPFAAAAPSPLPYDRSLSAQEDVLYHAYVYIRHILSDTAPTRIQLLPALRVILSDPHRAAERKLTTVPVEQLSNVTHETVLALTQAGGALPMLGLTRASRRDCLPQELPERRVYTTHDTPENRFVLAFLQSLDGVLAKVRQECVNDDGLGRRVHAECSRLRERLDPFTRNALWRDVGRMTHLPANSTTLQRRRGYRDVFRHFVLLRLASRHLPLTTHEARDLLEARDIAALYELWCYFQVVASLRALLGPPVHADSISRGALAVQVPRAYQVRWPSGVRAVYNATFSRTASAQHSYSLPLRPDVTLFLPDGSVHLLDAKFKLRHLDANDDSLDDSDVKHDDLHKMHAYRDAIERAKSAWVLYPGTTFREFPCSDSGSPVAGIGAIPLRPEEDGCAELTQVLSRIVSECRAG